MLTTHLCSECLELCDCGSTSTSSCVLCSDCISEAESNDPEDSEESVWNSFDPDENETEESMYKLIR